MKKIILILIFVLATTGCTVNYTLKYEDDKFTEYAEISGESEDDAHPTYDDIKKNGLYSDINGTERFTLENDSSRYDVKLSHTIENVKLEDLISVSECFTLKTIEEGEASYYVSLYGDFTCTNLENSTFTLETSSHVVSHNANKVDGNKYIWDLSEEKVGKDGINFQMMKSNLQKSSVKTDTFLPIWLKILILLLILGSGSLLALMLNKAMRRD